MFEKMKRLSAFLLALVMVFSLLPANLLAFAEEAPLPEEIGQAAYEEADLIFDQIDASESAPAKKNATDAQKVADAIAVVMASDNYVEGSLVQNGNSFTWETDEGIRCVYSPRMREIDSKRTPENSEDVIVNEPVAVKGGTPSGNQVYLVGPYYGSDDSFTDQYKKEAKRVAEAMGDTDGYTLYSGTSATVDKVAEAVANGAVVFFDSHGMTDYENPNDEYDFVTGATSSYLCLTSTTGLTSADYDDGALYYSDGICINGATIANHMTKNSPSGILWMAICLGMATNTMCEPLREMGVEVVYGYSQSVSFDGDYLFEEAFWDEMVEGATVADAVAAMKSKWGNWDWSDQIADYYYTTYYESGYSTISAARADYAAFPIVVSDEDTWPGQRKGSSYGADSLQTVQSTYTLFTACEHVWADATCTVAATCTLCGRTTGKPLPHSDGDGDVLCDVCGKDMSVTPNTYVKVTETPDDWSGQYIIVYEAGSLALNGSLSVLEATNNGFSVTIEDGVIVLDEADANNYFTIAPLEGYYTVRSASGYYIGNTTGSNKLQYSTSADYVHDLYMDADGSVLMEADDYSVLRFNKTENQMRFRFYKEASYTSQEPIALYKLEEGSSSAGCTHSYDAGVTTTAPTCTADGVTTYTCTLCGNTYTNSIPALGHTWMDATCTAPQTCSVCNTTTGSTADHTDANGDEACDVCGADMSTSDTPVVPPVTGGSTYVKVTEAPADWSGQYLIVYEDGSLAFNGSLTTLDGVRNGVSVTIADNTITLEDAVYFTIAAVNGGYTIQSASGYYIGNTSNSNKLLGSTTAAYTNTLSMDTDGSVLVKASGGSYLRFNAASDQMRFRYYKSSSYTNQKAIALYKLVEAVHEHSYESAVTTAPTCTATGVTTYTCSCGNSYTEVIAVLGHSYNAAVTAPTCVDAGFTTYTCANCGNSYKTDETAATGHTAGDALVENEKAPTCVAAGSYESVVYCSICDAEISRETVEVPATGEHTYDSDYDADCNVCGEIRELDVIADSALKFMQAPSLSFQDYIGMQVLMTKKLANKYDKVYVEAVQVTPEGEVTTILNPITYLTNYYVFDQQIMAWSMTEVVTLTLYAEKDGQTYIGQTYTQSVESLALGMLEKYSTNTTVCRMLVDMLNYGAAVQTQFSHNAENLPNTRLGDFAAMGSTNIPECDAANTKTGTATVKILNDSVSMQAKVEIQLVIKGAVTATPKATIGETVLNPVLDTTSLPGYTVIRVAVGATQLRETVTIALYDENDAPVTQVYNVSVEGYAVTAITGSQKDVVIAMMRYGDSVTAYANK